MSVLGKKILFIEDDIKLLHQLIEYFKPYNNVIFAQNKKEAMALLIDQDYDIIVLDVILPDGSGLDLLKIITSPTIILSTLGTELDIIDGLDMGAIDYIVKPCSCKLLEKKMELRIPSQQNVIDYKLLYLNPHTRICKYNEKTIPLTCSEFNILHFLITHPNVFFTSNEIYEYVWKAISLNTQTIRKHISSMRRKIIEAAPTENFIVTNFGKGYAFVMEDKNEKL